MSAPPHKTVSQTEARRQERGWAREGGVSEWRNHKDGHITEQEAVSEGLWLAKCKRETEFKTVSEQKLRRKKGNEKVRAGKGKICSGWSYRWCENEAGREEKAR